MKEVIEKMLATEGEAKALVSEGLKEAELITAAGRLKAVEMEEKGRREAQEEAARVVSEAEREAREIHDREIAKARGAAKEMKATGKAAEEAIAMVMKEVLGEGGK